MTYEQESVDSYIIRFNDLIAGHMLMDVDGFYKFWPDTSRGGYWDVSVLRAVCDLYDTLNAEWQAQIDKFFDSTVI